MHHASLRFYSAALDRWTALSLLIPAGRGPWSTLYLLHGLGGDHESWTRDFEIARMAEKSRLLIVMPEAGRSYYVNDPRPGGQGRHEDLVVRDVTGFIDQTFQTRPERAARAVAGLSMGGYGALMLALRHPELFGAAASLSAALYFGHRPHPRGEAFQTALAGGLPAGEYDCFARATAIPVDAPRPALHFNIGTEDGHLGVNREFHAHLDRLGWAHEYAEFPGRHDRDYWTARVPALVDFAVRATGA